MRRTLAKFGLSFEKATPLVHFPKALKRGVNRCERVGTGVNRCEQVVTGVKSFDQVLIPALRRSYENRCVVLFFLEGESHPSQILPTLRQTYAIIHFPKAIKRPRKNGGLASIY